MRPLAIDLFCGLGGWTEGLLAEGYRVIGFDNERHCYGEARYPAQLVIQDVLTLHGSQFKDAALIVASPPCQAYSYRAMPWKKAKSLPPPDNTLFEACFRIQREAEDAAGHPIPMVVENVCGAQKWVGRARWHYGSFYLWGDMPALMPIVRKHVKVPTMGAGWYPPDHPKHVTGLAFNGHAERNLRRRTDVGNGVRFTSRDYGIESRTAQCIHGKHRSDECRDCGIWRQYPPQNTIANAQDGRKQKGSGAAWWRGEVGSKSSKSSKRRAASAQIAKIPFELARHIARAWKPEAVRAEAR